MSISQVPVAVLQRSPIVVFDSGVGGLSVLKYLLHTLPDEKFLYFADAAWVPYGEKPTQQVIERSLTFANLAFNQYRAKAFVVACNTATAAAIQLLRDQYPQNIIVGVEPALKPAIGLTRTGVIGVLATANTLASEKFQRLINQFENHCQVLLQPCFGLAEQIEAGDLSSEYLQALIRQYVKQLIECGADVLVLGCTHYPFVASLISRFAGDRVRVLESGAAVAKETKRRIVLENLCHFRLQKNQAQTDLVQAFTTGDPESLQRAFEQLLGMRGVACLKERCMLI